MSNSSNPLITKSSNPLILSKLSSSKKSYVQGCSQMQMKDKNLRDLAFEGQNFIPLLKDFYDFFFQNVKK